MPKGKRGKRRRTPRFKMKHGGHGSAKFPRDETPEERYWKRKHLLERRPDRSGLPRRRREE